MAPRLAILVFCVCLLAMGGSSASDSQWEALGDTGFVKINNYLPNANLLVMCQSADTNLTVQEMAPWTAYNFSFKNDLAGVTVFTCHFRAAGYGYGDIKVWEGHGYANRTCTTDLCIWDVEMGGFFFNKKKIVVWRFWHGA